MGSIYIVPSGLAPQAGPEQINWSGISPRWRGERRMGPSSRGNSRFQVIYSATGDKIPDVEAAQMLVSQYAERCRLYWEEGVGSKPKFRDRLPWGLEGIPEPILGEWSKVWNVLQVIPQLPKERGDLIKGNWLVKVVAEMVCQPEADGIEQPPLECSTALNDENGFVITRGYTNLLANPIFCYPGDFDNGWTASSGLTARADSDLFISGYQSAHLVNSDIQATTFTRSVSGLSGSSSPYIAWAVVRRADGGSLSDSDLSIYAGAVVTTYFEEINSDGWTLVYGFADLATSATIGLSIESGVMLNVDSMGLIQENYSAAENMPPPFLSGDDLGPTWGGTAHNSTSVVPATYLRARLSPLTFIFGGSIHACFTVYFNANGSFTGAGNVVLFNYYLDADNSLIVGYDRTNRRYYASKEIAGSTIMGYSSTTNLNYGDRLWLDVIMSGRETLIYVNGVEIISLITTLPWADLSGSVAEGILRFGYDESTDNGALAVDGIKAWDRYGLSAAEVLELYTLEVALKAENVYLGLPMFWWTQSATQGRIENTVDGTASTDTVSQANYGVLGNVPGDAPAKIWVALTPSTAFTTQKFFVNLAEDQRRNLGRAFQENFAGTTDTGATWDVEKTSTLATSASVYLYPSHTANQKLGRRLIGPGVYDVYARLSLNYDLTVTPVVYGHGGPDANVSALEFKSVDITADAYYAVRYCGQIQLWFDSMPNDLMVGLKLANSSGSTCTYALDFIQLVPAGRVVTISGSPYVAGYSNTTDRFIIDDFEAGLFESDLDLKTPYSRLGPPLTVWPGYNNYLGYLGYSASASYDIDESITVRLKVTPRYLS